MEGEGGGGHRLLALELEDEHQRAEDAGGAQLVAVVRVGRELGHRVEGVRRPVGQPARLALDLGDIAPIGLKPISLRITSCAVSSFASSATAAIA